MVSAFQSTAVGQKHLNLQGVHRAALMPDRLLGNHGITEHLFLSYWECLALHIHCAQTRVLTKDERL